MVGLWSVCLTLLRGYGCSGSKVIHGHTATLKQYDNALEQLNQAAEETTAGPEDKYVFYHRANVLTKKRV
jgi:hypothetical protein